MSRKIDAFKFVDAAQSYTDNPGVLRAADQQWTDLDQLVNYILDFIPEKYKDEYLEDVTAPWF